MMPYMLMVLSATEDTTGTTARKISEQMSPYSTAVAPLSSARKRCRKRVTAVTAHLKLACPATLRPARYQGMNLQFVGISAWQRSQEIAKLGDKRNVCGWHLVIREVACAHPRNPLAFLRLHKAFPAPTEEQGHQQVKVAVVM